MSKTMNPILRGIAGALLLSLCSAFQAEARQVTPETLPPQAAPSADSNACCPKVCIRYVDRGCRKVCCCEAPIKTVLKVVNPQTCCAVDVPICLPGCCTGCPDVVGRCGMLGRGVVVYDWCCGYRVVVRFDPCGDVTVISRG